jgi:hypothetical protein
MDEIGVKRRSEARRALLADPCARTLAAAAIEPHQQTIDDTGVVVLPDEPVRSSGFA